MTLVRSMVLFLLLPVIISATVTRCINKYGNVQTCTEPRLACYNKFSDKGEIVTAGCDNFTTTSTSKCQTKDYFPYCDPMNNTSAVVCCCNWNECNKKTFSPFGVKTCYKEDGKKEVCRREKTTLARPKYCFNEFNKTDDKSPNMAGCDHNNTMCGDKNRAKECIEDKKSKEWTCCCPNNDCNPTEFTPSGVMSCYNKDNRRTNCVHDKKTRKLPEFCFKKYDDQVKEDTKPKTAGCDVMGKCNEIKGTCIKDNEKKLWLCCCKTDDCNERKLTPYKTNGAADLKMKMVVVMVTGVVLMLNKIYGEDDM